LDQKQRLRAERSGHVWAIDFIFDETSEKIGLSSMSTPARCWRSESTKPCNVDA
jgi:hypothetical protein